MVKSECVCVAECYVKAGEYHGEGNGASVGKLDLGILQIDLLKFPFNLQQQQLLDNNNSISSNNKNKSKLC